MIDRVDTLQSVYRRRLLAGSIGLFSYTSADAADDFSSFLRNVRSEAVSSGISVQAVNASLSAVRFDSHVFQLDNNQPEFTFTWAQYCSRVLPSARMNEASVEALNNVTTLRETYRRYDVDPAVIVAIWGIESDFGRRQGHFNIFQALATLAFAGRRKSFFRAELFSSLKIIDQTDLDPGVMKSSYAGAMGQPQFMPSAYLRFAEALDGSRRVDIWRRLPDVFSSIANYLARSGWKAGAPWGQAVAIKKPIDPRVLARANIRKLSDWRSLGVTRVDGRDFARGDVNGKLLFPDGTDGPAFMTYENFNVIRRYNPSDFYALAVGLLSDQVA